MEPACDLWAAVVQKLKSSPFAIYSLRSNSFYGVLRPRREHRRENFYPVAEKRRRRIYFTTRRRKVLAYKYVSEVLYRLHDTYMTLPVDTLL